MDCCFELASSETESTSPPIGLLISRSKLQAVLAGRHDRVYCRYARYAREVGAPLLFFAVSDVAPDEAVVTGYVHRCNGSAGCAWSAVRCSIPRVIYDRCFGKDGREETAHMRVLARSLGVVVVNNLPKITKLQAFGALATSPELAHYLPFTAPLTPQTLAAAMNTYPDLYLKPDALYKGEGVYRLTCREGKWFLTSRSVRGNDSRSFLTPGAMHEALSWMFAPEANYLVQEGLPLATYLGNRFDFRSLVQKNGQGAWAVTGLVARIAPEGSVITSPRSGGQIAPADRVLRHAFPDRWAEIAAELERASILLSEQVDGYLGPCIDLGLDVAVVKDGTVKLIEVNGKPLRVSLARLRDPLVQERIGRYPIHCSAHLARQAALVPGDAVTVHEHNAERHRHLGPLVGVLLGSDVEALLHGGGSERYRQMAREAREIGVMAFFCEWTGLDSKSGQAKGWIEREGKWQTTTLPIPDVIYHRATFSDPEKRRNVGLLLEELQNQHGVILLNSVNAFSKSQVHDALRFFQDTKDLAPDTVPFSDADALRAMLNRHRCVFLKSEHGSHGTDVLRVHGGESWQVFGKAGGRQVSESFRGDRELVKFLSLLRGHTEWVIQQGIELPQVEGRIFDFRVIVQKDGGGEWVVSLVLIRQAQAGSVAANMSQGGEPYLPAAFGKRFGHLLPGLGLMVEAAAATGVRVALTLESRFGLLGEIGVDIGCDEKGHPWVFEANTKPLHPPIPDLPQSLVRYPLHYAAYLAGRAWRGRCTSVPGGLN